MADKQAIWKSLKWHDRLVRRQLRGRQGIAKSYPVEASGFDTETLTHLLRTVDPGAEVKDFSVLVARTFNDGGGKVSTAGRGEIELTLADGTRRRAIIKLCRPDAPLQPLYRNEVAFYTRVRPDLGLEVPEVLGAEFDEQSGTFALVLEDLRERHATFPDVTTPVSLEQVRSLLDVLAALHSQFWEDPDLLDRYACIKPHTQGELFQFFMAPEAVPALVRSEIENEQFKREMVEAIGTTEAALYDAVRRVQHHQARLPFTLCHGDCHIGNTYLLPDCRAGLLDWQLAARGYCMHDISYLIITALSVSERRERERELICFYLDRLAYYGVGNSPSPDDAWYEYRLAANWCLYIGWLTTPKTHYGWEITVCNVLRLATAVRDLGSVALAAEFPLAPPVA